MDLFLQKNILKRLNVNQLLKLRSISKDWKIVIDEIIEKRECLFNDWKSISDRLQQEYEQCVISLDPNCSICSFVIAPFGIKVDVIKRESEDNSFKFSIVLTTYDHYSFLIHTFYSTLPFELLEFICDIFFVPFEDSFDVQFDYLSSVLKTSFDLGTFTFRYTFQDSVSFTSPPWEKYYFCRGDGSDKESCHIFHIPVVASEIDEYLEFFGQQITLKSIHLDDVEITMFKPFVPIRVFHFSALPETWLLFAKNCFNVNQNYYALFSFNREKHIFSIDYKWETDQLIEPAFDKETKSIVFFSYEKKFNKWHEFAPQIQ